MTGSIEEFKLYKDYKSESIKDLLFSATKIASFLCDKEINSKDYTFCFIERHYSIVFKSKTVEGDMVIKCFKGLMDEIYKNIYFDIMTLVV